MNTSSYCPSMESDSYSASISYHRNTDWWRAYCVFTGSLKLILIAIKSIFYALWIEFVISRLQYVAV